MFSWTWNQKHKHSFLFLKDKTDKTNFLSIKIKDFGASKDTIKQNDNSQYGRESPIFCNHVSDKIYVARP